jgi:hypothetical protein
MVFLSQIIGVIVSEGEGLGNMDGATKINKRLNFGNFL